MDAPLGRRQGAPERLSEPGRRRLHVVFLIRSFGFPEGMAATHRVRLLGRALIEQGASVRVLCTRVSELPGEVLSAETKGTTPEGISFRYTTHSTVRSDSFIVRRLREALGFVGALVELTSMRRRGSLDCVYLTAAPDGWRLSVWLLVRAMNAQHVPVVVEFNELPGDATWLPSLISHRFSHLDGMSGAVAISRWLAEWVSAEAKRIHRSVAQIEIPIVVDTAEQRPEPYPDGTPTLVYSASTEYGRAVTFLLKAMPIVWRRHGDCRLVVTGMRPDVVTDLVTREGLRDTLADGRVVSVGYVDRPRLLELHREASALLIPLFDDLRSRARFPTKVGEYLASGRPVVTTDVGETERYLGDAVTAYVATPSDPTSFADRIIEVLDDPARAAAIGQAGRRLAEEDFDYSLHGPALHTFLTSLSAAPAKKPPSVRASGSAEVGRATGWFPRASRMADKPEASGRAEGSSILPIRLAVTIDTEADGQWDAGVPVTTRNVAYWEPFQELCETYGVAPTYLVATEIVEDDRARDLLGGWAQSGAAEIGAHLHPWTTPPYVDRPGLRYNDAAHAYPSQLPDDLLGEKLTVLTRQIGDAFGRAPTSYRAGRFGFDTRAARHLARLGYSVDSSVTPLSSWRAHPGRDGEGGPDFRHHSPHPFRIEGTGDPDLLEIPVTVLATYQPLARSRALLEAYRSLPVRGARKLVLSRWLLPQPMWLTPDPRYDAEDLVSVWRCAQHARHRTAVMMFHSSELMPGGSPFRKDARSVRELLESLDAFFSTCTRGGRRVRDPLGNG